jgi:hypothetical protein
MQRHNQRKHGAKGECGECGKKVANLGRAVLLSFVTFPKFSNVAAGCSFWFPEIKKIIF